MKISGDFICRHHDEPRVQLDVPKEETVFSEYIDGDKSTHTILHVLQEKRSDDDWNVDANRILSDSWTGFTKYTLLKKPQRSICGLERD